MLAAPRAPTLPRERGAGYRPRMAPVAVHAWISGLVQGVAFRHHARSRARELGVAGWVRNADDGRVELWAEGEPAAVDALVEWIHRGPPTARVTNVAVEPVEPRALAGFEVRRA